MLIPLLSAGNFVIGMGAFMVIGLITPLAADLGVSAAETGLVLTLYAITLAVGSPVLVALTGRWARRAVLILGMTLFALGAVASALAPGFEILLAARVLSALGAGMFTPVTAAVAAAISPPERRGRALAAAFAGITLAQVVGVPFGSWLAYHEGWRTSFAVVAAIAVPVLIGLTLALPRDLPVPPVRLASLWETVREPAILAISGFTFLFLGAIYVLYTFLQPLMERFMGFGPLEVTAALVIFGVGAVIGNMLGGRLADRVGPVQTLTLLALSQAALMPVFLFVPMPVAAFLTLVLLWSVAGWSFTAPQQMRLVAAAPERQSLALSLNASAIYLGTAAGSALGGALVAAGGLLWLGPVAGGVSLLALLLLRMPLAR